MNTSTTTQTANSDPTDQVLCLVPDLAPDSRPFWAACAVNDETLHRVYSRLMKGWIFKENTLAQRSLCAAETALWSETRRSFREAQKSGVLLFAWYGSSALTAAHAQAGGQV